MRVAAFDIGILNFALCILKGTYDGDLSLANCATALASSAVVVEVWDVLALATQKRPSNEQLFEGVVGLVQSQLQLLGSCDAIVIETQMTARMKAIAACLFGALRALLPEARVAFQSASAKLSFGDLASFSDGRVQTYAQRKKTAVQCARALCAGCPSQAQLLAAAKKKDDLADALLHALAALAVAPKKRRPADAQAVGARTKRR